MGLIKDDPNVIYPDLKEYCEEVCGFKIIQSTQINRGWLNLKWKIETNRGIFLLKQYNQERLKSHRLDELHNALKIQQRLYFEGVACPRLLTNTENMMHETENGQKFVIMEYCEGENVKPGKANENQMYELGCQTGKMHRILNSEIPINDTKPQFIPPSKESRLDYWVNMHREAEVEDKQWLQPFIELQIKATEELDFSMIFDCEVGLAHRDLWVDNILFCKNKLSAILDFDRLKMDYPELDIARAIISCSLDRDYFQLKNAEAFLSGYRTKRDFPKGNLERALRMLWYMESTWWINKNMDQHSVSPARFTEEMVWLSKNHSELNEIIGNL